MTDATHSPDSLSAKWFSRLVLASVAVLILPLVAVLAIVGSGSGGSSSDEAASSVLDLVVQEFSITGNLSAPAGNVVLNVSNEGSAVHNVAVESLDLVSADVNSGEDTQLDLGVLEPGEYEIICAIPGHKDSGMVTTLTVTEGGSTAGGDASMVGMDHSGESEEDFAAMDRAMMESMLAFPAETEGRGNPVLEPTEIASDGTKIFDLTAEIVDWEVEPGRFVEAWAYNGVVPGPQILLDRGDKVKIRVLNKLPMGTDVHWHGVHTPNDQDGVAPLTQELIEPDGGTFDYEFTVEDDAIGMYHAHNHGQMQVVNGLFGVIRVGKNPVPLGSTISGVTIPDEVNFAVDMPMVLNDAGTIGFSLNGKSFPATDPLVLKQGDWASITYYNEGLQAHPMHLHQFPQLVYAKDGVALDQPYWADTINIAPGERYTVMFRADDVGTWVWHCHILNHVERAEGMFGMVTAIVVEANPAFDPTVNPVVPTNWRKTAG